MSVFLPCLLIFLGVSGAVYSILELALRRPQSQQDRLHQIHDSGAALPSPTPIANQPNPLAAQPSDENVRDRQIRQELQRAGLRLRPREFFGGCFISGVILAMLALPTHSPLLILSLATLGLCLPWFFVRHRQAQRIKQLEVQLTDGALLLTGALRAGGSFSNALRHVAGDMPAPLGEELRWAVAQTALGMPMETALNRLDTRIRSEEWGLFSAAIAIQLQVGGNLPETLDSLAATLRERRRMQGEIQTLTAEGKLSGLILFLLTPGLTLLLCLRNPHYFQPLLHHPLGLPLIIGAVCAQLIGGWVLKNMTEFDL